jgi:hypothetical protein
MLTVLKFDDSKLTKNKTGRENIKSYINIKYLSSLNTQYLIFAEVYRWFAIFHNKY